MSIYILKKKKQLASSREIFTCSDMKKFNNTCRRRLLIKKQIDDDDDDDINSSNNIFDRSSFQMFLSSLFPLSLSLCLSSSPPSSSLKYSFARIFLSRFCWVEPTKKKELLHRGLLLLLLSLSRKKRSNRK